VYLSLIFNWFGEDFVKAYGTNEKFQGHNQAQRAVLSFITPHLDAIGRAYLDWANYDIAYLDYDWSLNEQRQR
jgi:hypothetical protein